MHIRPTTISSSKATAAIRTLGGASAQKIEHPATDPPLDTFQSTSSSAAGALSELRASEPKSEPVRLERPLIFVHGFTGTPDSWAPMADWLTKDGQNKNGGVLHPDKLGDVDAKANVFALEFSRSYNRVETNAEELKKTIEAVCKATGQKEVDLVVHSMGGLDTRKLLQEPDEKIRRVVMVATPNRGSQLANLELFFRDKLNHPIKPPINDPEVKVALNQLRVDRKNENPFLKDLNRDWDNQHKRAEVLTIGGTGVPTLTGRVGLTIKGDGTVPEGSLKLPGVENKKVWFKRHGSLPYSPAVMENAAAFLATGKTLSKDENLYDSEADKIEAKELRAQAAELNKKASQAKELSKTGGATPQQVKAAAQLPILDPAFQFGFAIGVLGAMMGGPYSLAPLVDMKVSSSEGDNSLKADYTINADEAKGFVQGKGVRSGQEFRETANLVDGKMYWSSGQDPDGSGLVIEVNEDEKTIDMYGKLNGVNTDLHLTPKFDDNGFIGGIDSDGLLNGEPYHMHSLLDVDNLMQKDSDHQANMTASGFVNGGTVEKSYDVSFAKNSKNELFMSAQGVGTSGYQDQNIKVEVTIADRR